MISSISWNLFFCANVLRSRENEKVALQKKKSILFNVPGKRANFMHCTQFGKWLCFFKNAFIGINCVRCECDVNGWRMIDEYVLLFTAAEQTIHFVCAFESVRFGFCFVVSNIFKGGLLSFVINFNPKLNNQPTYSNKRQKNRH